MLNYGLLWLLLVSAATVQTQYGTAPKAGPTAHARTGCPWLTQGNAAWALGGDVSVTVNVPNTGEGSCVFSREQTPTDSLEILVSKSALPACPPESGTLKGIGNEAATCRPPASHGESLEMISSRVRDLHFTVTLISRGQKGHAKPDDPQSDVLEQVAEQVAGNLY
jgi:hypothetical protein